MSGESTGATQGAAATSGQTATTGATTTTVAPTTTAPAPSTEWTAGLNDELKGYAQTKGFKDPAAVLESYRNFEKLQGVPSDRVLKIPESMDTPEGRAIWEKLGRPKDAKDYSIEIPKEYGDEQLVEWVRSVADKGNMTQKQVETFVNEWNARSEAIVKAENEKVTAEYQAQEANLKRDWGQTFEQNINVARQACNSIGISKEQVDAIESALGYEGTMRLLHKLGSATGEAQFVSGQSNGGQVGPEQAKSRIAQLQTDKGFISRYISGDTEAKREFERLHQIAYPGQTPL